MMYRVSEILTICALSACAFASNTPHAIKPRQDINSVQFPTLQTTALDAIVTFKDASWSVLLRIFCTLFQTWLCSHTVYFINVLFANRLLLKALVLLPSRSWSQWSGIAGIFRALPTALESSGRNTSCQKRRSD